MRLHRSMAAVLTSALLAVGAALMVAGGCDGVLDTSNGSSSDEPTRTPGPRPDPGPSPEPSPEPTPEPTATPSPTPDPTPLPGPTPLPSMSCALDADCDDGMFCNGLERCVNTHCQKGDDPCPLEFEVCDEETDTCVLSSGGCQQDADCAADEYCDINTGLCQLEVTVNCGPGAGTCYAANLTPGCESQSCCEAICPLYPMCCLQSWDETCAALAFSSCPLDQ